ncbi:unnamed protein product [Arctogadus glacialis]
MVHMTVDCSELAMAILSGLEECLQGPGDMWKPSCSFNPTGDKDIHFQVNCSTISTQSNRFPQPICTLMPKPSKCLLCGSINS